eukprot:m.366483 g.366483  ORF g.366483 m.366483 type:complete len:75 (-) comp28095_c0_seq1:57-281(-)
MNCIARSTKSFGMRMSNKPNFSRTTLSVGENGAILEHQLNNPTTTLFESPPHRMRTSSSSKKTRKGRIFHIGFL